MPVLRADDGTILCFHIQGRGSPVVCLPGGPMLDSVYLGDLGGLSTDRQLIVLDNRGTGGSQTPADSLSYRCDRLVDDVEALRRHLDLDSMDLLAHSAGANLGVLYAVRHPQHIRRLVLITPSTRAVGIDASSDARRQIVRSREQEPWFAEASAAFETIAAGTATDDDWEAITPFTYGRWDAAARAHHASMGEHQNVEAAEVYGAEGAFDPESTRRALEEFWVPVLILAGEHDVAAAPSVMAELAALFPSANLVTQPGAGHYPWLDDPHWFTSSIARFLQR